MRSKLMFLGAALAAALLVADLVVGSMIEDGRFRGQPVPPYWEPTDEEIARLRERARLLRAGEPTDRVIRAWSERYGWTNAPGREGGGGNARWINSLGARGAREVAPEPPAGMTRVLCFGESFTYGAEVADGEDWPARLEAREDRLEVVNFGVQAWGTDQALLRFREVAPGLAPDVVILGLMLENIGRNVNRARKLYSPRSDHSMVKPRYVLTEGRLELVPLPYSSELEFVEAALAGRCVDDLEEHEYWTRIEPVPSFSNIARALAAQAVSKRRRTRAMWLDRGGEPYRVTLELLEAFRREALELGAREAVVVLFQTEGDHRWLESPARTPYWSNLLEDLEQRGIPCVDTFETIRAVRETGRRGYGISHHDPPANDLIAELVLGFLAERLPELR